MQQVVNITVPVCYKGDHFPGVTVHNGVTMEFVDNCGGGKSIQFGNASLDNLPSPNAGCVSSAIVEDDPCHEYLQIHAAQGGDS